MLRERIFQAPACTWPSADSESGLCVSFFLGVDDVDEYYRELKKRAQKLAPADEGWGGRFITLQDPDKYRLFFVEWSERGPAVDTKKGRLRR